MNTTLSGHARIPVLHSNEDYDDWRRALKDFLCSKGLWLVASGEQTLPRKPTAEETRRHIENMQKAKGYICSTLNETVKALVDEDDEPPTMLAALQTQLGKPDRMRKVQAIQELGWIHLATCPNLAVYFAKIGKAICTLNQGSAKVIGDEQYILLLMAGLTEDYTVMCTLINQNESQKVEQVKAMLNQHALTSLFRVVPKNPP